MDPAKDSEKAAGIFLDHFGILPEAPDRETLEMIIDRFSLIPWENLTKFLARVSGRPPGLLPRTPATVISQYASMGTGGTCFSLTEALGAVLSFCGFRCYPVMADMRHGSNIHCALAVHTGEGERFLADPGYLVPVPVMVRKDVGTELRLPGQTMVWEPASEDRCMLFTVEGGERTWRYTMRMRPVGRDEFLSHWMSSFAATGMNSLHANLRTGGERISAHNMNLRRTDGLNRTNVKLRDRYAQGIQENFGIDRRVAAEAEREWRRECRDR